MSSSGNSLLGSRYDVSGDLELLNAWKRGDREAGSTLVRRHFESVYLFFHGKTRHDIDDLIQRTFLACVEARDRVREGTRFKAYLMGIARRLLYHSYRDEERHGRRVEPLQTSAADHGASPSAVAAGRQEHRLLQRALTKIPLDHQITLELQYWEGLSIREIADVLGIPEGTARSRVHRAREALRKALMAEDGPEDLRRTTADKIPELATSLRTIVAQDVPTPEGPPKW